MYTTRAQLKITCRRPLSLTVFLQPAKEELERMLKVLFHQNGILERRSYSSLNWAFYRAFLWINEQNYQSRWTQWKFLVNHRKHPSNLAVLAKVIFTFLCHLLFWRVRKKVVYNRRKNIYKS